MILPSATCRRCGAGLNPSEARGLCPVCLLETSMGAEKGADPQGVLDTAWLERNHLGPVVAVASNRLGDYELYEEIGRGGMGVIYRAKQLSLDRFVAVKTILTGPFASLDFVQRFHTEAHAAAVLDHPHIVPIFDVGADRGQPYYSMRLISGRNLAQALRQDGPLSPRRAATLISTVARAVHYAHQRGVLHRDLKPANILIDSDGQPHITDFGLAKLLQEDDGLTLTQATLGTPNYMAPEQASGKAADLTIAADTYSLGAILFEALTGQRLFASATPLATINQAREREPPRPSTIVRTIPRDLEILCLKCLEKDPARRYGSAAELADELDRFLKGEPIWARRVGAFGRTCRWCRRKPVLAAMTGAVGVLLLAVTVVSTVASVRIAAEARRAEQNALELRLNLYVADMNLAHQAVLDTNLGLARELVSKYFPEAQAIQGGTTTRVSAGQQEDLRGWEWRYLWRRCQGDSLATLHGHSGSVSCAVFSPDGKSLVTAGFDHTVRVWDVATRRTLRRLTGFGGPLQRNSVTFSPDGGVLAVADGKEIHVFETASWSKVRTLPNQALTGSVFSLPLAFSPDAKTLSCNGETEVRHWDTASWERHASRPQNLVGEFGRLLAYSPNGKLMATGKDDGIVLWDTSSNPPSQRILGRLRWPTCVTFSPDGRLVAAVGQDDPVVVWDVEEEKEILRLPASPMLMLAVAFSPDGRRLIAGGDDQLIRMWEMDQGKLVATLKGALGGISALGFSPDGQTLVSANADGAARLWSAQPVTTAKSLWTAGDPLGFSADSRILALLGTNCAVEYWDVRSGNRVNSFKIPRLVGQRDRVAVSPNGALVAHVCTDGAARIWDRGTGDQMAELTLDPRPKWALAVFSPDSRLLATSCQTRSSGGGGWTLVWDFRLGKRRMLPGEDVYRPAFSPDGSMLATGFGNDVQLWSLPELKPVAALGGHKWSISGLAFSPDGALLASMARDSEIRLWDVATGRLRLSFRRAGSGNGLRDTAFSPDGRTLASGAVGNVALWNVAAGKVVLPVKDMHRYHVGPMFSPDGNILVIGGDQGAPALGPVELLQAPSLAEIEAAEKAEEEAR